MEQVRRQPDATLEELRHQIKAELGIAVSIGTLRATLRKLKLAFKKVGPRRRAAAAGRSGAACGLARAIERRPAGKPRGDRRKLRGDPYDADERTMPAVGPSGQLRAARTLEGIDDHRGHDPARGSNGRDLRCALRRRDLPQFRPRRSGPHAAARTGRGDGQLAVTQGQRHSPSDRGHRRATAVSASVQPRSESH